jgi:uncharacterized caspase-like protein
MQLRRAFIAILAGVTLLACGAVSARTQDRMALVIGNGDYRQGALKNARNDARAMAQALRATGFDVTHIENVRRDDLIEAFRDFTSRSRQAQTRLVYYAGHGAQLEGQNFVLPVDVSFSNPNEFTARAANLSEVIERLGRNASGVNIVIVDACRDVPLQVTARVRAAPVAGGFAPSQPPAGTFVAYATAAGAVARDGTTDANSPYTKHLVAQLSVPGLPIEQVFKRVRAAVIADTNGEQKPWEISNLTGDFCFKAGPGGECGETTATRR